MIINNVQIYVVFCKLKNGTNLVPFLHIVNLWYFISKELYLVINQLNYSSGEDIMLDIPPTKIKIK